MKKIKIEVPKYTDRKHGSEQNVIAYRMPSRVYVDKKKESKKMACRNVY